MSPAFERHFRARVSIQELDRHFTKIQPLSTDDDRPFRPSYMVSICITNCTLTNNGSHPVLGTTMATSSQDQESPWRRTTSQPKAANRLTDAQNQPPLPTTSPTPSPPALPSQPRPLRRINKRLPSPAPTLSQLRLTKPLPPPYHDLLFKDPNPSTVTSALDK